MVTAEVNEAPRGASPANASTFVTLQVGEDLLDRFLKSDPLKAVEELIWNALDAEATEVVVKIEEQTEIQGLSHIQVKDNGHGMQPEKCCEYFGYQGNSWKKARHRSLGGLRPVHGRHGEGRLFALGLSSSPTWTSVADDAEGRRLRSVVRTSRLSPNRAEILPATATDEQIGTVVDLPALQVSAEISRHLGVLVSDRAHERLLLPLAAYLLAFPTTRVVYRGRELKPQDDLVGQPVDIGMAIPTDSWLEEPPVLTIYEWKSTKAASGLFLCTEEGAALCEVELRRPTRSRSVSYTGYVRWRGFTKLGGLDTPEATYRSLIDEADHILASFVAEREQELLGRMEEEWEREQSYPWKTKPQSLVEQAERDLFAVVATVARKRIPKKLDDRKTVFALLRATLESNPSSLRRIINEVLRLDPDEQAQLNELLDRTSLSNIIKLANEIGHRLDVVRVLHEVLVPNPRRTAVIVF